MSSSGRVVSAKEVSQFWDAYAEVANTRSVISSTETDLQGDTITSASLEQIAKDINRDDILINIEHDPTLPPVGLVSNAAVEQNTVDSYLLYADIQPIPIASYLHLEERRSPSVFGKPDEDAVGTPRYVFAYNPHNVPEDIVRNIAAVSERVDLQEHFQKSWEAWMLFGTLYIVGISLREMAKGFGDEIGHQLGQVLSRKASQVIRRQSRPRAGSLRKRRLLTISIETKSWKVHGHIVGRTTKCFQAGFDALPLLAQIAQEFGDKYETGTWAEAHFRFNYNDRSWDFIYAVRVDKMVVLQEDFFER